MKWLVGILIVAVVSLTFFVFTKEKEEIKVGQVIGTSCQNNNGIFECHLYSAWNVGSTTVCSFPSPEATSTIVHASANVQFGTTTAYILEIGKDTVMDGTTTRLATMGIGANSKGIVVASSSLWEADNHIIGPSKGTSTNYVNFKVGTEYSNATNTTLFSGNSCEVIYRTVGI